MAIDVECPCSMRFRAKEEFAGKRVKCPSCSKPVVVPVPPMPPIEVDEEEPLVSEPDEPSMLSKFGVGMKRVLVGMPQSMPASAPAQTRKVADQILNASTPFEREVLAKMDRGLERLDRIEGATNTIRQIMVLPFIIAGGILAILLLFLTMHAIFGPR